MISVEQRLEEKAIERRKCTADWTKLFRVVWSSDVQNLPQMVPQQRQSCPCIDVAQNEAVNRNLGSFAHPHMRVRVAVGAAGNEGVCMCACTCKTTYCI